MAKSTIVGLRELRENTEHYIDAVGKGKSFTVVRRSKPIFRVVPVDEDDEMLWDTVVDFSKIRAGGVPMDEVITALKRMRAQEKNAHGSSTKAAR